jgi:hypothetical protein
MFRAFALTLSGAGLLAGAAMAAAPTVGTALGTDSARIAAVLAGEHYQITRFEQLPEIISVTAVKEHRRLELALDSSTGTVIGAAEYEDRTTLDDAAVKAALAAQGYAVTGFKRDGDEIEVEATRDGRRWELEVDPRSGAIREMESEEKG